MKIYIELFWSFLKVTLSSFGGGYVLLPLLQEELVRKRKWIDDKDLINYYALGQVTPGIISMNVAMFTGYKVAGRLGSFVCAMAVSLPSLVLVILVIYLLSDYLDNKYVVHALNGIKVYMVALIAHTIIDMFKKSVRNKRGVVIFLLCCASLYFLNMGIVFVILLSAVLGCVVHSEKVINFFKRGEK